MKTLIVDRNEGQYTICEDLEQKLFAIDTSEVPEGTIPGTVLQISDEGTIVIDKEETEKRKQRMLSKQNKLKN